jgi:hypothetical protein
LSRHFAMLMPSPLAMPAAEAEDEDEESRLQAGLASRILSGPGLWLDWLAEIDRRGLVEELLAGGIIDQAVATAPHGHQLDRALNAKTTLLCVLAGCLFPGEGYDEILRITFGMPGLDLKPAPRSPPARGKRRCADLESVLGATPQEFESLILRHADQANSGSLDHRDIHA